MVIQYLSHKTVFMAKNALVSNPLDVCNDFFRSLSQHILHKLHCIKNSLVRVILKSNKYLHATHILKVLQDILNIFSYTYLCIPLPKLQDIVGLTDGFHTFYIHPPKTHFNHSITCNGPTIWNELPADFCEFIVLVYEAKHQNLSSHFPVSYLGSLNHPADIVKNINTEFSFS